MVDEIKSNSESYTLYCFIASEIEPFLPWSSYFLLPIRCLILEFIFSSSSELNTIEKIHTLHKLNGTGPALEVHIPSQYPLGRFSRDMVDREKQLDLIKDRRRFRESQDLLMFIRFESRLWTRIPQNGIVIYAATSNGTKTHISWEPVIQTNVTIPTWYFGTAFHSFKEHLHSYIVNLISKPIHHY
ncbi:MAG: hypothetical protein Harvfovirus9_30 [Harvfovirus sp.]|uniref:Uncharacterized protein n=1 Tax=Harvfovirus sp. TaxID=2487768 RepID=A0A3G5A184_9VIRU|nr:MAG: hypothetical protein Harvfovirus9_30 [Harvfovirus sp.]